VGIINLLNIQIQKPTRGRLKNSLPESESSFLPPRGAIHELLKFLRKRVFIVLASKVVVVATAGKVVAVIDVVVVVVVVIVAVAVVGEIA